MKPNGNAIHNIQIDRAGFVHPELGGPQRATRSALRGALAGALLLSGVAGCKRTPNPDVWATVNGHPIMQQQVQKYFQNKISTMPQQPTQDEASTLKLDILHHQIDDEVMKQRAEKLHLVATDAEVDAQIAKIKAPYTEQQFNDQLKAKGLTLEDLRRDAWLNMTTNKVLNKEITSKINITDADVANFYNLHKVDFNVIEPQYHLAQIVVTGIPAPQAGNLQNSKARNDEEARKKIQALHNQLESGADFSGLAANYSEQPDTSSSGGDMGFIAESQLKQNAEFFDAIAKLRPGQITEILPIYQGPNKKPFGYVIYKLIAVEPAGQHPLSDPRIQQMIRQQLRDSRTRLLQSAYYEVLRNQARVVNYYAEDLLKNIH
ncbi:MAG: SurA N-terminal domain-containing protein [Acidobacteriaceae bacterium]